MKRLSLFLLLALAAAACLAQGANGARVVQSLNFGWRFHAGDVAGAEQPAFDDTAWQTVDLPHDFQISQPWVPPAPDERPDESDMASNVKSRLSARAFKEMGIGWYRLTLTPDPAWQGRRVLLDFEGIMLVGDVYVNGQRMGGTDYGYLGFDIDVSQALNYGKPNVIAVRADTRQPGNSRWYTGGGLYRDVHLVVTDAVRYFVRHPLYITTPHVSTDRATVVVQAEMACRQTDTDSLTVQTRITDADGRVVADHTRRLAYRRAQQVREYQVDSLTLTQPRLWDCDSPHLYTATVTLYHADGSVADQVSDRFGIRSIAFGPDFGFRLNGRKVLLKGNANHHTLGALGAAAYPRAMEKRIQLLKAFGFNHIRTSHNPYSETFLDLCDEYGILVVDELYDKWLTKFAGGRRPWTELWQHDVPEFVKRDRNHPSVIMWSLGNELQTYWDIPYADWGVTPYRLQRLLLHRYDQTRPVTVAMHPRGRNLQTDSLPAPLVLETDIAAYNYRYMYFPGDRRRYPHLIFYQSEANLSMMGTNFYAMDLDRVTGLAYWGMIDYLGESLGWPAKGWVQGAFGLDLEPKPRAWLLKSMFCPDEPVVHIGIVDSPENTAVWNDVQVGTRTLSDHWNRTPGSLLSLYTYTNADEVELRLNGRSLGRKRNPKDDPTRRDRIRWDSIAYAPGHLEAIALRDGRPVARHRIETTGRPVRLEAQPDNPAWTADGIDLQHVRVQCTDRRGRRVPDASQPVSFSVEGPAQIVGVVNGDMTSDESLTGSTRSLYQGTVTVILRAGRTPGPVTLKATAPGVKAARLQLSLNEE